jgi:hypothetical protein
MLKNVKMIVYLEDIVTQVNVYAYQAGEETSVK